MDTLKNIPVIGSYDTVLWGSQLPVLARAASLADSGQRLLIVTRDTCLLQDICSRSIISASGLLSSINQALKATLFDDETCVRRFDQRVVRPDALKRHAEAFCKVHGIDLLYNEHFLGIYRHQEKGYGLLAGKHGLCAVCLNTLYIQEDDALKHNAYHLHVTNGPADMPPRSWLIYHGPVSYRARLIPGSYDEGHYILEIQCASADFTDRSDYITECQHRCLMAFAQLKKSGPQFQDITAGRFSPAAYVAEGSDEEGGLRKFYPVDAAAAVQQFYPANAATPVHSELSEILTDFCAHNTMLSWRNYPTVPGIGHLIGHHGHTGLSGAINDTANVHCDAVTAHYDVIVAGGGTSGAMAAIYAARYGAKTLLIEMNEDLGGTQTAGGVHKYWFGNHFSDVDAIGSEIRAQCQALGISTTPGIWSADDQLPCAVRSYTLRKLCRQSGVGVLTCTTVFGVHKSPKSHCIDGLLCASGQHALACHGKIIIDATGDGDVAALAGAAFQYGSDNPAIGYWASLAQYTAPDDYKNNFSSNVIVSDPVDYTRFIIQNRQRGVHTFDHGTYVSPRESRHIKGRLTLTLKDILSFRQYDDGLYTVFSNYDPKGLVTADMVLCGVLIPPLQAQIPLRCLLPVDDQDNLLHGLLVIGKAISCTHNAFPGLRMQPDLMHQGAVAGRLAAWASAENKMPEDIDPHRIRELVTEISNDPLKLPDNALTIPGAAALLDTEPPTHWVDVPFTQCIGTPSPLHCLMAGVPETVLSALDDHYPKADHIPLMAARIMVWHGSKRGLSVILSALGQCLSHCPKGLPRRQASIQCANLLPDHGVMPEAAYDLYLIAWPQNRDILPVYEHVFCRLLSMAPDFDDVRQGYWHYVHVFAYAAQHTGFDEFIPLLRQLLQQDFFTRLDRQPCDTDSLYERLLLLRLLLHEALARCGDTDGYVCLAHDLSVPVHSIAYGAYEILNELTDGQGACHGMDPHTWLKTLTAPEFQPAKILITQKVW